MTQLQQLRTQALGLLDSYDSVLSQLPGDKGGGSAGSKQRGNTTGGTTKFLTNNRDGGGGGAQQYSSRPRGVQRNINTGTGMTLLLPSSRTQSNTSYLSSSKGFGTERGNFFTSQRAASRAHSREKREQKQLEDSKAVVVTASSAPVAPFGSRLSRFGSSPLNSSKPASKRSSPVSRSPSPFSAQSPASRSRSPLGNNNNNNSRVV
ncbi:unnamed protein product, partial [Amoebophrya sp. A25]|eukprot:GSA25T00018625001.1